MSVFSLPATTYSIPVTFREQKPLCMVGYGFVANFIKHNHNMWTTQCFVLDEVQLNHNMQSITKPRTD